MEKEQMKKRIYELENQLEKREQYIKQIEKDHKTELFKFSEYFNQVKRYFPYVKKLLPLIDYCWNTMHFSDAIIRELCKFKKVPLKGKFYSSEFNRYFESSNAVFSIKQDKDNIYDLKIDGVSHNI